MNIFRLILLEYLTCSRQDVDAILKSVREAMEIVGKRTNEDFLIQATLNRRRQKKNYDDGIIFAFSDLWIN